MIRLTERTMDDVLVRLPDVTTLEVSTVAETQPIGRFLCAVGFEERCTELARQLAESQIRIQRSVILRLSSNIQADEEQRAELKRLLSPISNEVLELNADADTYVDELSAALGAAGESESDPHVVFDISVGANRLVLRTMCALLRSAAKLDVWYTEARTYHPTRDEFERDRNQWMKNEEFGTEIGVLSVTPSTDFSGEHLDSLPDSVVVFPSFRHERSAAAISHVDPALQLRPGDNVVWILGTPHLADDLWRREAMREINRIASGACVREASTFDYKDTYRILSHVYDERWETSNITVAPLGSKFQAIAISLFCIQHSDVRVLFATPKKYNTKQWSVGCRATWRIDFGSIRDVRHALSRIGSLELHE